MSAIRNPVSGELLHVAESDVRNCPGCADGKVMASTDRESVMHAPWPPCRWFVGASAATIMRHIVSTVEQPN